MAPTGLDNLPRPTAFVLAGGASLGAVQLGMLRAVLECGIEPDFLVGTSVGAINATYLAQSVDERRLDKLAEIWSTLDSEDVFPRLGWRSVFNLVTRGGPPALASQEGIRSLLRAHAPRRHADLETPVAVVATDLLQGDKVVFEEGDLHEHVLASTAIPGVFSPVEVDGRALVDGGVVANVPVLPARALGAESMVVLDPGYPCDLDEAPSGALGYAMYIVTLMLRHQSHGALHFLGDDTTVLYPPPPCPLSVAPHRFDDTDALIDKGYETARLFFEDLTVDEVGVYGHPHFHPPS